MDEVADEESPEEEGQDAGVPASMADLFFTLIAVVVLMLLALLPAIRTPGALAPQRESPWQARLTVEGRTPLVLVARRGGLLVAGEAERSVALDRIVADPGLGDALRRAAQDGTPPLVFVTAEGGEAAFLLDALAGSLGLATLDQVRIDRDCRFAPGQAGRFCDPAGWAGAS